MREWCGQPYKIPEKTHKVIYFSYRDHLDVQYCIEEFLLAKIIYHLHTAPRLTGAYLAIMKIALQMILLSNQGGP